MMKKLILLAGIACLVFACGKKTEEQKAPLSFSMKNFRVESAGGCVSDTIPCAYYDVNYPEFTGLDTAVNASLIKLLDATVSMGNPEAEGKTMKQVGEGFIKDYEEFKSDMPDAPGGWHYNADATAEVVTDTLISISVQEEFYTGGAHGGYGTYFINIRPSNGAEYTLDDFFKPGYEEQLRVLGEKSFRKVREIADTASLNENYFEFPDDKFELNKNFGFRKEGIVFFYNSYEIAAYAAGPTEVMIPYEEVKDLIK